MEGGWTESGLSVKDYETFRDHDPKEKEEEFTCCIHGTFGSSQLHAAMQGWEMRSSSRF